MSSSSGRRRGAETSIEEATPGASVCTQDDVTDGTFQLPVDPVSTEQGAAIDACWTTHGFVFRGI